jgi:triphosphatase
VLAAIALVRHTLVLFGGIVPRKASAHLRDLLTQTETLMLSDVSAQTAIYSPQAAAAKLALTEWLVTRGWRAFLDAKAQAKIAESLNVSPISIFPAMPPS